MYTINVIVMTVVIILIISITIYWLVYRRREGRFSANNMYLQADSATHIEDNFMIDGYTIKLSKGRRQMSETRESEQRI